MKKDTMNEKIKDKTLKGKSLLVHTHSKANAFSANPKVCVCPKAAAFVHGCTQNKSFVLNNLVCAENEQTAAEKKTERVAEKPKDKKSEQPTAEKLKEKISEQLIVAEKIADKKIGPLPAENEDMNTVGNMNNGKSDGKSTERKLVGKIAIPGELIGENKRAGAFTLRKDSKLYSTVIGIVSDGKDAMSVIPLRGRYDPRVEDAVVGIIVGERFAGFDIDIDASTNVFLPKSFVKGMTLKVGDIVSANIDRVNEIKEVDLGNVRVFFGGEIIKISPVKVPRLIGKNASMLDVLRNGTNAQIFVGKNGIIWAKGGNINLLAKAVKLVEDEAHLTNLTNRVNEFLLNENKVNK